MTRISKQSVIGALVLLNKTLGREQFTLDMCNGGYRILENDSRDVSPRGTAREAYNWVRAMVEGADAGKRAAERQLGLMTGDVQSEAPVAYEAGSAAADTEQDTIDRAMEILRRRYKREASLTSASSATDFLKLKFCGADVETFGFLALDSQHSVLSIQYIHTGTIDGAAVYPREVVKTALECSAAAVILFHNHPSGNPEPSQADIAITSRLKKALDTVDIRTLDHVILAGDKHASFASRGMI